MEHRINYDAISEGVFAFIATYPDEAALDARSPLKAPRGAHAVLWVDDFYRGVDVARDSFESIVGRWRSMRTKEINEPSRAQAVSAKLDKVVVETRALVESLLTHLGATVEPGHGARFRILLNRHEFFVHHPHHGNEFAKQEIKHLRECLAGAGVSLSKYDEERK